MGKDDTELEDKLQELQQQTLAMHMKWQQEQATAHACEQLPRSASLMHFIYVVMFFNTVFDGIMLLCKTLHKVMLVCLQNATCCKQPCVYIDILDH